VTSYKITDPQDRVSNLLDIMPQLEHHHGKVRDNRLSFRKGFVVQVVGLALSDDVSTALRALGFSSFVKTREGFRASKEE
jgi:hypothetical protein